jgi:hypothetical protein
MMAQAPQPQQPPQTPPAAPQASAASTEGKVTVTGCLKTAPADPASATNPASATGSTTPPGTASTPGAVPADAKFLLTDATSAPASDSAAAPAPPAAPAAGQTGSTYRLIANPNALTPHVGKKLALTGTIDKSASAQMPQTLALRVESGKIVAETCAAE